MLRRDGRLNRPGAVAAVLPSLAPAPVPAWEA